MSDKKNNEDQFRIEFENGSVIEGIKSAWVTRGKLSQILHIDKLKWEKVDE